MRRLLSLVCVSAAMISAGCCHTCDVCDDCWGCASSHYGVHSTSNCSSCGYAQSKKSASTPVVATPMNSTAKTR